MEFGLVKFSQELQSKGIEHFVFFGTLLGLTRESKPIAGDDDVDFYVSDSGYDAVRALLISLGFELDFSKYPNNTRHLIQAYGILENIEIRVDFYFFDATTDKNFLLERWNFLAQPNNQNALLKVPKPLVYPIEKKLFLGQNIAMPKHPEILCEFLYGVNWKTPKKKRIDYQITIVGGRPLRMLAKDGGMKIID
jgi:hypothetical protein